MRKLCVSRITAVINSIVKNAKVEIFGSFETSLYLPTSDIDICIFEDSNNPSLLLDLFQAIKECGISSKTEHLQNAKVPIIKFTDKLTKFNVDVSLNMSNGVEVVSLIKELLNQDIGAALKPLMLMMKLFLLQRHLNEVFTGGLSSYGLLIMIVSFLKSHPRISTGQISAKDNLGILLIEFLDLYGKKVNYEKVGIGFSQFTGGYFFDKTSQNFIDTSNYRGPQNQRPIKFCIQDPNDHTNDVSKGTRLSNVIKHEFAQSFNKLTFIIARHFKMGKQHGKKGNKAPVLNSILGSILTVSKSVLVHREYVETTWQMICKGEIKTEVDLGVEIGKKRKHVADFEYQEYDSDLDDGLEDIEEGQVVDLKKTGSNQGKGKKMEKQKRKRARKGRKSSRTSSSKSSQDYLL